MDQQSAPAIMMVRPASFGFNEETAASNAFQVKDDSLSPKEIAKRALAEFESMVKKLREAGAEVLVMEDPGEPYTPDSIFPNNWVSFHGDGKVVLYPMESPTRRKERRQGFLKEIEKQGFSMEHILDFSAHEQEGRFLEGTGSIIFDYPNKIAYANRSSRTHGPLLEKLATQLGYQVCLFDALDPDGKPIYHTNVLMCQGSGYVVLCTEVIPRHDRERVISCIQRAGHVLVDISFEQLKNFAGNMLEVQGKNGPVLVMSQTAYDALNRGQKESLKPFASLLAVEIPTIEKYGGGSARCMMASVNLPKN